VRVSICSDVLGSGGEVADGAESCRPAGAAWRQRTRQLPAPGGERRRRGSWSGGMAPRPPWGWRCLRRRHAHVITRAWRGHRTVPRRSRHAALVRPSPGRRFSVPDVLASSSDTGCAGGLQPALTGWPRVAARARQISLSPSLLVALPLDLRQPCHSTCARHARGAERRSAAQRAYNACWPRASLVLHVRRWAARAECAAAHGVHSTRLPITSPYQESVPSHRRRRLGS
jgi:hypothetical protein